MDKQTFMSVMVSSMAGGFLKILRGGNLSFRRLASEIIGAVIIGLAVYNVLNDYTSISFEMRISLVSVSAIIWTHILEIFKDYLITKFKQ